MAKKKTKKQKSRNITVKDLQIFIVLLFSGIIFGFISYGIFTVTDKYDCNVDWYKCDPGESREPSSSLEIIGFYIIYLLGVIFFLLSAFSLIISFASLFYEGGVI